MTTLTQRRYDIDWLRVLGVLALVPFHAALIFVLDPHAVMYIKDSTNSQFLKEAAGFIHMWHMPVLFVVSGSATYYALNYRSAAQYVRERLMRLFIPLIFGIVTYIPLTTYIQNSGTLSLPEAYLGFYHLDLNQLDGANGTFTPAHLWFILYLFLFSLIGLPVFLMLRSKAGSKTEKRPTTPASLVLICMGLLLTGAAMTNILQDKNPIYYFLVFLYGYLIASNVKMQQGIYQMTWGSLAFGLLTEIIRLTTHHDYPTWTAAWITYRMIYEMGRWMLTLAVLGLGSRFLNRNHRLLRYANEAAMPFYLLHMTFTVLAGFFVVQLDAPVAVKYPLIVLSATGSTLLAYEVIRRWKVSRWLFGLKSAK